MTLKPATVGGASMRFGVIDVCTPPNLEPAKGSRRGYVDTGVGYPIAGGARVLPWWAKPDKSEVDWPAIPKAVKPLARNSIVLVDIEHPWQPDIRKTTFQHAMESRHTICRVLAEMKAARPDLILGAYAAIPNLYWESLNSVELKKWRDAAAFCKPIIDASDIVCPVSYLHYDRDDDNDEIDIASDSININNEVGEAMKLAGNKPVVPFVSAQIYDGAMTKNRDVSLHRFKTAMQMIHDEGVSGVAFWEWNRGQQMTDHQRKCLNIAIEVFGKNR